MKLTSGTLLQRGKYKIERVLGQGGFGITYLATQVGLNRRVAIKEFFMREYCNRDTDTSHVTIGSQGSRDVVEKFRSKFVKEAQNIACLKHPHIISIYDVFEENGTAYYVMEYLDRGALAELVKLRGRLSEADALRYTRQIADALCYIHANKMNHLDVKPGNILIDETDGAVLIDFGLSKRYDDEGNQTSTTPVGISHGYAPLEQYKKGGVGTFSPSTDIYSLGATLYKLITGDTPLDANDVNDEGLPAFPSYVSPSVASAIEQAMQPRRKDRPQTIEAFLALLDAKDAARDDEETLVVEVEEEHREKDKRSPQKQQSKKWLWPLLTCVVAVVAFFGVRACNDYRAEVARLAAIEQHRLDSIAMVKEAARLAEEAARLEKHRRDSIAKEKERLKAEDAKRIAEEKRREEERLNAEKAKQTQLRGVINGHEWVDLGLSVKWATCNVGASSPSDYGNYYAWGETRTKSDYEPSNSVTYDLSVAELKSRGIIGTDGNLTPAYDAARANWGGTWRMPTLDEIRELNKCTWTWTSQGGHNGYRVTGPNGKSIFLPAAGYRDGASLFNAGTYGDYWSATPYSISYYAYYLRFYSDGYDWDYYYDRDYGRAVRPVSE